MQLWRKDVNYTPQWRQTFQMTCNAIINFTPNHDIKHYLRIVFFFREHYSFIGASTYTLYFVVYEQMH